MPPSIWALCAFCFDLCRGHGRCEPIYCGILYLYPSFLLLLYQVVVLYVDMVLDQVIVLYLRKWVEVSVWCIFSVLFVVMLHVTLCIFTFVKKYLKENYFTCIMYILCTSCTSYHPKWNTPKTPFYRKFYTELWPCSIKPLHIVPPPPPPYSYQN